MVIIKQSYIFHSSSAWYRGRKTRRIIMKGLALSFAILFGVIWLLATFNGCQRDASAHPHFGSGGWSAEKRLDFITYAISAELDLTDDQKGELDRIAQDLKVYHESIHPDKEEAKSELLNVLSKDRVTAEELIQIFDRHKTVLEGKVDLMAAKLADFHAILTPEQRTALIDHMEAHGNGGCRFGRGFHGPGKGPFAEKRLDIIKYMISSELDLTDDQKDELDRIAEDMVGQHEAMRSTMDDFKTGLISELSKDQVAAEDLKRHFETAKPALEGMVTDMADKIAAFHTMLTPEQRAKVLARMESHGRGCRWGRHRW
jgi:Spy/CpxP family protein refolding chaperone